MKSAKNLRMPFPSFTLALSRQEAGDNSIQERNASESNVEPSVDLMVSLWQFDGCRIETFCWYRKHLSLAYHATIATGKRYAQSSIR